MRNPPYYSDDAVTIWNADALALPVPDQSVDLVVTSPPYFGLRSYQDGGEHYSGQIGSEATPAEFVDALIAATAEMVRVLKPSGSIWVNLGDRYAGAGGGGAGSSDATTGRGARPKRTLAGADMTREQAAWLAGVIDSDGSIGVHINKQPEGRAPSFVPWVRIGQMRPEVVQRAAEVTGIGNVCQDARGVWNWAASAQQARWILRRVHPWLVIKPKQAAAAVELARHIEERNGRGEYRPLTANDIAYRQQIKDAVNAWNKGDDHDWTPPNPEPVSLPVWPLAAREKSLHGVPWEYAQRCIGQLGLILRAEVIWSKPNGLPESVTDRVRRSHETWFHFTVRPRYFSAVDEVREEHKDTSAHAMSRRDRTDKRLQAADAGMVSAANPLGKLPGSVWDIPTQPLRVPDHLGIDHFAAFPMEWPRRIIRGWSPAGVCVECGEGRRPVSRSEQHLTQKTYNGRQATMVGREDCRSGPPRVTVREIVGEECACPEPTAPTTPGVVLDPFGGTGTTALVARSLGRRVVHVDLSADYCRLAQWRVTDPGEIARAMQVEKPPPAPEGVDSLLDLITD